MGNRNYQAGRQGSGRGQDYGRGSSWRNRDDEGRFSSAEDERDTNEQSGSTGRYAGYGDFGQGDYSGGRRGNSAQDRYGQSGYGQGGYGQGNYGQGNQEGGYGRNEYRGGSFGGARDFGERYGNYGRDRGSAGTSQYSRSSFSEYGYGGTGAYNEPYGEGQQYSSGGQYAGESGNEQWGQHRGKGPKGYQRSDERLKELISERLREDPHIDPSEVTVSVQGGKITLDGTVDSRHAKNAIEDIAEQFGVEDVQNNLRVQKSSQSGESATKSGKSGSDNNQGMKQNKH
jgi:osmotically-inducible protein OsmY